MANVVRCASVLFCVLLASCATARAPLERSVVPTIRPAAGPQEATRFAAVLKTPDGFITVDPETLVRSSLAMTPDGVPESLVMLPSAFVVTTESAAYLARNASPERYERVDDRPEDMVVVGSDEAGRTLIWYHFVDDDTREYFLRASGSSELMPFASVAYPGEASVSVDGRFAAVSGIVQPCSVLWECPMKIWVWRADTGQVVPLATPPNRAAYKPQFVTHSDGATWLYYQTTAYDTSPLCDGNLNACEHTIVRRRAEGGPETVVARRAFAFTAGRDGVTAYLSHDVPRCDSVLCGMLRLHLVDIRGDRVVADPASSLRPRAFSPDGRWLLYRDENSIINALEVSTSEVHPIGEGFPMGWLPLE